jgi:hypothetical protein
MHSHTCVPCCVSTHTGHAGPTKRCGGGQMTGSTGDSVRNADGFTMRSKNRAGTTHQICGTLQWWVHRAGQQRHATRRQQHFVATNRCGQTDTGCLHQQDEIIIKRHNMRHAAGRSLTCPPPILLGVGSWGSIVSQRHRAKVTEMSYFFRIY